MGNTPSLPTVSSSNLLRFVSICAKSARLVNAGSLSKSSPTDALAIVTVTAATGRGACEIVTPNRTQNRRLDCSHRGNLSLGQPLGVQGADLLVVGGSGHSELYGGLIGGRADRIVHRGFNGV